VASSRSSCAAASLFKSEGREVEKLGNKWGVVNAVELMTPATPGKCGAVHFKLRTYHLTIHTEVH